MFLVSCFFKK